VIAQCNIFRDLIIQCPFLAIWSSWSDFMWLYQ